jgi:hypothetical protein
MFLDVAVEIRPFSAACLAPKGKLENDEHSVLKQPLLKVISTAFHFVRF